MHLDVYGDTLCAVVTAAALASTGNYIHLRLPNGVVADALNAGACPYKEPGLAELLTEQIKEKRLFIESADTLPADNVRVVFLAVSPNAFDDIERLMEELAGLLPRRWLIVNQSTFPVGSTGNLEALFLSHLPDNSSAGMSAVSLPDLLQEGAALQSFIRPTNLILGCDDVEAEKDVREIISPFNRRREGMRLMRPSEAEFTKLAINGMLATRLSFMNDMASLADVLQVDIENVRLGMGADPRIGDAYLYAGCGFGGLSFSRDVMSLAHTQKNAGEHSALLDQVLKINERQKEVLFRKLWKHYKTDLKGRKIALWGAAFKPGTGRIENAPSLTLIDALLAQGAEVHVHDPMALPVLSERYRNYDAVNLSDDAYDIVRDADALILVTEWKEYWAPDFDRLKASMRSPLILDGRNIYQPDYVREKGFDYYGVGRG